MLRYFVAAMITSSCLALALSFVPTMIKGDKHVPTFQAVQTVTLTEQNLVDLFTFTSTHYNIKRVKWEDDSLYVDVTCPPEETIRVEVAYDDFYAITYRALTSTRNVNHLHFRFVQKADEREQALLTIQAARQSKAEPLVAPEKIGDLETYVERRFQVNKFIP